MKILKFKAAYVEGRWVSPFYITLNAEGVILEASEQAPSGAAEAHDQYLLPGVPNGHSHSFQYAMSGLSERVKPGKSKDDFWFWREQMYTLANAIGTEDLLAVSTQLYMNLLEQGYTSVCEFHYLHHDRDGKAFARPTRTSEIIMEAAKQAGITLTLVPVYYNQAAPNVPIKPLQRRFYTASVDAYLSFVEQTVAVAKAHYPDVTVGYGVHSMRAAPLDAIKTIMSTPWTKGPAHLHASEQVEDVRSFQAAYGALPMEWLAANIPLGPQHNLVHATHMSERETNILAASGATVVLCPTTESNLGDGIFPLGEYHRSGGSWCIGSDSQVNLNPFREMLAPEQTQRLLEKRRNVFCTDEEPDSAALLFQRALTGGRRALGLPQGSFTLGTLLEGLLIDPEHDRLLERSLADILAILIFAPEESMVTGVFSKGQLRVQNGRHEGRNKNRIAYGEAMRRLLEGLSKI